MSENKKVIYHFRFLPNIIFTLPTAMIGYHIHNSIFWAIIDFIFWPIVWIKWLILQEVNLTIIKETFNFLLQ
jgi:hypothetical protein